MAQQNRQGIGKDQRCTSRPKPLKAEVFAPKIHSEPFFCGDHISVSPHIRSGIQSTTDYICTLQTMRAAKEPEVIDIPDEEEEGDDDWQDVGPINIREV